MIVFGYLWLAWDVWPTGAARTFHRALVGYSALSLWVTWPQLTLAVVGGFFTRLPGPLMGRPSRAAAKVTRAGGRHSASVDP
jgi:hypothetical protein